MSCLKGLKSLDFSVQRVAFTSCCQKLSVTMKHHLGRDHESFLGCAVCRLPASSDHSVTPSLSPPKLRITCPSLEELLSIHGHEKPQELE